MSVLRCPVLYVGVSSLVFLVDLSLIFKEHKENMIKQYSLTYYDNAKTSISKILDEESSLKSTKIIVAIIGSVIWPYYLPFKIFVSSISSFHNYIHDAISTYEVKELKKIYDINN